jgi:hypothetical protein
MTEIAVLLRQNLSSVQNERNEVKRSKALLELWSENGIMSAGDRVHVGHDAINRAAGLLLRQYPEFDFTIFGRIDEIPGAGRLRWLFGAQGESPAATGEDVVIVCNGRITALYKFLDGAAL